MSKDVTQYQEIGIGVKSADEFVNEDGWNVQRVVYDVPGHDVQVLCYNGDTSAVVVAVDNAMSQMPLARADGYIRSRI